MRERLIDLVDKAKKEYASDVTDHNETDYIVECLLNEGVIVLPCKAGDKVYVICEFDGKVDCETYTVDDITIYENNITIHASDEWLFERNIFINDFGKTVFLSREDAERALKGGATE